MINNKYLKILKTILFFYCFFSFSNYTHALVDAGSNQTVSAGSQINFSGYESGFEDCDEILYYWYISDGPTEVFVNNAWQLNGAYISSDQTNIEGEYYFVLEVTGRYCGPSMDDRMESDDVVITIESGSSNSPPNDIVLTNDDIDENVDSGTRVGNFMTTDPDDITGEGTYKYYLVSGTGDEDNNLFQISGSELRVNHSPDFEDQEEYSIRVQTQDSSYASYEEIFTIYVNDIDETIPQVNAGSDQSVKIGTLVNLNGSLSGFPDTGCNYEYAWMDTKEEIMISNAENLTGASFETESFSGTTKHTIRLDVYVTSTEMTHDSCGKTGIYNDSLVVTISEEKITSSGGGISYSTKMEQEAERIFEKIDDINLKLENRELRDKETYKLVWNYLGGRGKIKYELLYSKNKDFEKTNSFITSMNNKTFLQNELDLDSFAFFFKVRALYDGKKSSWSNIVSITNKQSPLRIFEIICYDCDTNINYRDVFKSVDLLIEKHLDIICKDCNTKMNFKDVWHSKELILDRFKIQNKDSISNIDFKDVQHSKELIFDRFKVPDKPKTLNIDFTDSFKGD